MIVCYTGNFRNYRKENVSEVALLEPIASDGIITLSMKDPGSGLFKFRCFYDHFLENLCFVQLKGFVIVLGRIEMQYQRFKL